MKLSENHAILNAWELILLSICHIICAGDAEDIRIIKNSGDYVIAVDAGFNHCEKNHIVPDLVIGDFDSLGFVPEETNIVSLPVMKDDTDTFAALKEGMKKGYTHFIFYAAAGGSRPEHTYANMALLAYLSKQNMRGFMDCGHYTITALTDGKIEFSETLKGDISVFSFDNESTGVTETGLLYALDHAVMHNTTVTGISNAFTGQKSAVSVENGTLLVYYSGKPKDAWIV